MEKFAYEAVPNDSRYTPFTQQSYCCVPTSIQMIMYRNGISLIPAEEIGYHLGLTVPPEDADLFFRVRVSEEPPAGSGYGTQIQFPEYEPNQALKKLQIPLVFSQKLASSIESPSDLVKTLREVEEADSDALLCFNHGVIRGEYQPNSGHVVVFDKLVGNDVQIVDVSPRNPKWRTVSTDVLFDAIQQHGDDNAGGVWHFTCLATS
jgi:hypothetical protein